MAEPLAKIAVDKRWLSVTVYCELWQEHSLAGVYVENEPKYLTLFDVAPYKQCFIAPTEFRKLFEDVVPTPKYLGQVNFTRGFVQRVWNGEVDGITFEGVVGKSGERHGYTLVKCKTKAWVDAIKSRYSEEEAKKIIES